MGVSQPQLKTDRRRREADYSMSSNVSNGFDCSVFYTFSSMSIKNSQLKKVRTDFRFCYSLQVNNTVVSAAVWLGSPRWPSHMKMKLSIVRTNLPLTHLFYAKSHHMNVNAHSIWSFLLSLIFILYIKMLNVHKIIG